MLQEQMTLPVGANVRDNNGGSYVVEAILGVGGFSAVYKVRDRRTKQRVFALKEVINPNEEDRRNLGTEAALLMRLNHSSLPRVYQVFENVKLNRIYLLMDYIEGKNLEVLRKEEPKNRFSIDVVLPIMSPIVNAVIYLHRQKPPIVHRDIKPPNIIVPKGTGHAILVDFGLAKEYVAEKTTNILRYGTPGYAAPEQYAQGTNPRTDIYGFGATIYNLLTGVKPIDALLRIVNDERRDTLKRADAICPEVPTSVAKVLERAMSLRSEDRFPSIEEFWQSLGFAAAHPEYDAMEAVTQANEPFFVPMAVQDKGTLLLDPAITQPQTPFRHPSPFKKYAVLLVSLLAFLALSIPLFFWLPTQLHTPPTPTPTPRPTIAKTTISANFCAPSPTISPDSIYPLVLPCYGGTIDDIGVAKEKTDLYLTEIKQDQSNLSGSFHGLNVVGTFRGTIQQNGDVKFEVTLTGRTDTIIFTGSNKYGGDMRGNFEFHDSSGQASLAEYGSWYAQPMLKSTKS